MNMSDSASRVVEHSDWIEDRIRGASWRPLKMSRQVEIVWAQRVTRLATPAVMLKGSIVETVVEVRTCTISKLKID